MTIRPGHRLEYVQIAAGAVQAPTLVFLHEGLGAITMWRDFPEAVCRRTGCGGVVYARLGHGRSDPLEELRPVEFMHHEALVTLPQVLEALGVERPVLIGHSDGGSIALIHAGAGASAVEAVLLEAPHVFCEDLSVRSIAAIRDVYETTDLRSRLARHHGANTDGVFYGWNDVWLRPEFRNWNIEKYLPGVRCPVLVIQGSEDEYGTLAQVDAIARGVTGFCETTIVPGSGHAPHLDARPAVEDAMVRFIEEHVFRRT